ncbi:hypothetical protein [Labedaea rhizosphaerae]|uniref:Uncharacterized protein n=1 Tax=Labedaea rhizosphaerae TaxID=598644 RepID=A0A4R6SLU7_LABRH|nr:hypothetical protein [Labedaea rhizosphaerae]TDQ05208.1 hypothetical protein EV186_1011176 [Labedaea rhizosphaerae]
MARVRTETAARVRRVVSRGLLVVGGVVAGTAAAWLLSSATASAETQPHPLSHPGLGSVEVPSVDGAKASLTQNSLARNATKAVKDVDKVVQTTVHAVTAPSAAPIDLSTVVGDLDASLHGEDAQTSGLGALGDQAKNAFSQVGEDLAEKFGLRAGGQVDVPSEDVPPVADGQPGDSSPIVGPVSHPQPVVGPRAAADGFTAPAVQDRLRMGGLNRGSPATPEPLRAPVSPLPAPLGTSGHSSSSAGGQDGPAFGALPSNGFRALLAVIGTSRPAVAGAPVHTGAQPGNTPD